MHKIDFKPFQAGTMFNRAPLQAEPTLAPEGTATIDYPARLEAMVLDPSQLAPNDNLLYPAGQIDVSVALYKRIAVTVIPEASDIVISGRTDRQSLVRHAAMITRALFGVEHGLSIDVTEDYNLLRHCGLGSSSGLIAGTVSAINELYGNPLSPLDLSRFATQNHGEEIDDEPTMLMPVQCVGGSAICGNFDGSLIVIAGEATPIMRVPLPKEIKAVIGVPRGYTHPDAHQLSTDEQANRAGFENTGKRHGTEIAYRLVHEVMPGLAVGNLAACKQLVFDYRWEMGSIKNCSFVYPPMLQIAEALRVFRDDDDAQLLSLSSLGPGFFVLTTKPTKFQEAFETLDMQTITTDVHNDTYRVIKKEQ